MRVLSGKTLDTLKPMLSILIPVYNFDVQELVKNLSQQAVVYGNPFEIIVVDDASAEKFRKINKSVASLPGVKYYEEPFNTGRSKIRNKLADLARYDNLLYLDCDSKIDRPDFIKKYMESLYQSDVVYGGRNYYHDYPQDEKYLLHWLYGINREQICVDERSKCPNKSFMTNNFIITREAINRVRFNENIRGYGHEDTLFGYDLLKCHIMIKHIDNPVIHLGLEPGQEFLRKTKEGIKNLRKIMGINGNEKKLVEDITLLAYYKRVRTLGLRSFIAYLFRTNENRLQRNLMGHNPRLFLFDLYKLGYLCTLTDRR